MSSALLMRLKVVGVVLGATGAPVLLARGAATVYYDPALWALAGRWVPPDGGVFIVAGGKILAGQDPYLNVHHLTDALGYVYPPILAMAISPLSLLPGPDAAMAWSILLVACIVGALRLLDVRDWRCFIIALLWPFTREALAAAHSVGATSRSHRIATAPRAHRGGNRDPHRGECCAGTPRRLAVQPDRRALPSTRSESARASSSVMSDPGSVHRAAVSS